MYPHCFASIFLSCRRRLTVTLSVLRYIFVTLKLSSRLDADVKVTSCAQDLNFLRKNNSFLFFYFEFFYQYDSFVVSHVAFLFRGNERFVSGGDLLRIWTKERAV